jgi:hypothetical protein
MELGAVASGSMTLVSSNKLSQFRVPSFKPKIGITQANFEWRTFTAGEWQGNGHLVIK